MGEKEANKKPATPHSMSEMIRELRHFDTRELDEFTNPPSIGPANTKNNPKMS